MRYGVISDVHGRYETLLKACEYFNAEGVDTRICLGDVLDAGDFLKCIDTLVDENFLVTEGNHDSNQISAYEFFMQHYDMDDSRDVNGMMRKMKMMMGISTPEPIIFPNLKFSHTTTSSKAKIRMKPWDNSYLDSLEKARDQFMFDNSFLFFFGHTHNAWLYVLEGQEVSEQRVEQSTEVHLEIGKRYLCNPGGFISHNDEEPDTPSCAVYDPGNLVLKWKFLE